jgi:hypothetical protein
MNTLTKLAFITIGSCMWGIYLQSVSGGVATFCLATMCVRLLYDVLETYERVNR